MVLLTGLIRGTLPLPAMLGYIQLGIIETQFLPSPPRW